MIVEYVPLWIEVPFMVIGIILGMAIVGGIIDMFREK